MRKIFSILVVLMMVAGTFVSCSMPTNDASAGDVNTGSSTVPPASNKALKEFMNEHFAGVTESKSVYSGRIRGTENNYVLIPATAAVPSGFSKVYGEDKYLFGNINLTKDSVEEGINIYFYRDGEKYFDLRDSDNTIHPSERMLDNYFGGDTNINESIDIGGITFYIKY